MSDPTPTATARITNRNLKDDERDSRQAILQAVDQEKCTIFNAVALGVDLVRRITMRPSRSVMRRDARLDERSIVRHQHQRGSFALVERDQQFQHMLAVLRVQIAGRLVGQQNRRPNHERAGQRDALLFAAGKLDRVMIAAVQQADAFEQFARALGPVRCHCRRSVHTAAAHFLPPSAWAADGRTENEADFAAAQQRHAVLVQAGDVLTIQNDLARGGRVQTGQKSQAACSCRCPMVP